MTEYGALIEVGVGAQEIPYPYVIESGDELTPTMKLKRKPIAEKYAGAIDAMYG